MVPSGLKARLDKKAHRGLPALQGLPGQTAPYPALQGLPGQTDLKDRQGRRGLKELPGLPGLRVRRERSDRLGLLGQTARFLVPQGLLELRVRKARPALKETPVRKASRAYRAKPARLAHKAFKGLPGRLGQRGKSLRRESTNSPISRRAALPSWTSRG